MEHDVVALLHHLIELKYYHLFSSLISSLNAAIALSFLISAAFKFYLIDGIFYFCNCFSRLLSFDIIYMVTEKFSVKCNCLSQLLS